MDYGEFLASKAQLENANGFAPVFMPQGMFDFQEFLTDYSVRMGRSANFSDCGMGKTFMELAWGENVVRKTNRPVLLFTPLAVAAQTVLEGEKFGIEAHRSAGGKPEGAHIVVTNYEKSHHFDWQDFAGVICDESSILKSFNGVRRGEVTEFMRRIPYRLLATATAAPNDFTELGTSSEALGMMGLQDMLNRFFKNDQNTSMVQSGRTRWKGEMGQKWRFKGHAERAFFRWVCSWARACRKPSDLGFDDGPFLLPELQEREHVVEARNLRPGELFSRPAMNMQEEREERRRTIEERCERAASLVADTGRPAVLWCHLNDEGDMLTRMIRGSVQVSGKDSDEEKEEKFLAFQRGKVKDLIIKPKIGAFGLNWQHCNHVVTFASHSFEQYYQAVRRCWRFGQKHPVTVDLISSEGEIGAKENLQRKARQADQLFSILIELMNNELRIQRSNLATQHLEVPAWL